MAELNGTGPESVVTVADGAVTLDGRPVLRHIDLTVASGEFVAVMGANGSGKSTLVRTMLGFYPLATGMAHLFGVPLADFHQWQRVGFVPQRSSASSGVPSSVWEVVASGRLSRRRPFLPLNRAGRASIDEAIATVGLEHKRHDSIATLSGGQQQRALIARALAGEPDVLFLDEPTAGVDLPNQEALAVSLGTLSARGVTVVLVAHELGPLAPLVDRAVVMADGRIVYDGPPLEQADVFSDHGHHVSLDRHDHIPHLGSPLEGS